MLTHRQKSEASISPLRTFLKAIGNKSHYVEIQTGWRQRKNREGIVLINIDVFFAAPEHLVRILSARDKDCTV